MAIDPVIGGALIKGVLGILGGGKKGPTPHENLLSQASGARGAAEQFGFNPLTMLQYGQAGGSATGGAAPSLASNELLMGAIDDITDVATGENARRRAANDLEMDLGRIKLEQLRGGVTATPVRLSGGGMGRTATTVAQSNVYNVDTPLAPIVVPRESHVRENITTGGDVVSVPVGPDPEEILSGYFIDQYGKGKQSARLRAYDNMSIGLPKPFGKGFAPSTSKPTAEVSRDRKYKGRKDYVKSRLPFPLNQLNRLY